MDCKISSRQKPRIVDILINDPIIVNDWSRFVAYLGPSEIHGHKFVQLNVNQTPFDLFTSIIDAWSSANGSTATIRNLVDCLRYIEVKDCAERIEAYVRNNVQDREEEIEDTYITTIFGRFHSFFDPEMCHIFVTDYYERFDSVTFAHIQSDRVLQLAKQYCEISYLEDHHETLRDILSRENNGIFIRDMLQCCLRSLQRYSLKVLDFKHFTAFSRHLEEDKYRRAVELEMLINFNKGMRRFLQLEIR